jgi:hypothetical protein
MPVLKNPRHETFAQLRAKGAGLEDAYEDAGFAPYKGNASRLASQDLVAERIAELRAELVDQAVNHSTIIAALMRIAKTSEDLNTPEGAREARATLLEADRLLSNRSNRRCVERINL